VITTTDRGAVIHFAGRHHLSPALRDGAPVLAGPGDPAGRSGWAPFFSALERRGLAARFDPGDGTSFATVPRDQEHQAHPAAPATPEARAPVAPGREALRFLEALRGRFTA
jgi:hypothetical protein